MYRIIILCLLVSNCVNSAGCSWLGRTAGKAQAKIERNTNSVQQGYEEGYKEEKAKQKKQ